VFAQSFCQSFLNPIADALPQLRQAAAAMTLLLVGVMHQLDGLGRDEGAAQVVGRPGHMNR